MSVLALAFVFKPRDIVGNWVARQLPIGVVKCLAVGEKADTVRTFLGQPDLQGVEGATNWMSFDGCRITFLYEYDGVIGDVQRFHPAEANSL